MSTNIQIIRDITKAQLITYSKKYESCSDILRKEYNFGVHSSLTVILMSKLQEWDIKFEIPYSSKRVYDHIEFPCPVCGNIFTKIVGSPKEQVVCSVGCANTYFKSGENNPNHKGKGSNYRNTCFIHHRKICVVCGESNVLEVHHRDKDRTNDSPENLVPLCPTHHKYCHSEFFYLIENKIDMYIKEFNASIAQMEEQLTCNEHVPSSNLGGGSNLGILC